MADSLTDKRWGYYLSVWLSLGLPYEPIPQIELTRSDVGYKALEEDKSLPFHLDRAGNDVGRHDLLR